MPQRATRTSFTKGRSGNPGGRSAVVREAGGSLTQAIRKRYGDGEKLVEFLARVVDGTDESLKDKVRLQDQQRAVEFLAEWGYQKPPPPPVEVAGADGEAVQVTVQVLAAAVAEEKKP